LRMAMELGDGKSKECTILIPAIITLQLENVKLIESLKQQL